MSAERLRQMVEQATPGDQRIDAVAARIKLEELAPELAKWAADAADALAEVPHVLEGIGAFIPGAEVQHVDGCLGCRASALLARLSVLTGETSKSMEQG